MQSRSQMNDRWFSYLDQEGTNTRPLICERHAMQHPFRYEIGEVCNPDPIDKHCYMCEQEMPDRSLFRNREARRRQLATFEALGYAAIVITAIVLIYIALP